MKNMKLSSDIKDKIRDFVKSTQSNHDLQNEMDRFMDMISPSLRMEVTK
jgi:hypothetical protein